MKLKIKNLKLKIVVGWLYPELMSTYGDRGNIIVLQKRCLWREIETQTVPISFKTSHKQITACDLIFGGGAQDRQQSLAIGDLLKKGPELKKLFSRGVPGLFVCGSPQLLGHYFIGGDGNKLKGLGIFNMVTKYSETSGSRCIGNLIAKPDPQLRLSKYFVGFENHGGRTFLGPGVKPFAKVIKGFGNNGQDGTEGALYKNVIATYSHGPFLPKNPQVADWLIQKALEIKYGKDIQLEPLDDTLEWKAHDFVLQKLGVKNG